ncbi:MAG: winged helix-turn-helix domain-containing protein [Candidatus Aenigmatarchaeota archaeon]
MNEEEAKSIFLKYLQENKIEFFTEREFPHCKPDFVFKKGNFWYCVEVKGDESDVKNTLGEIISYFTDFSHVFLCAPPIFLNTFINMLTINPELENLRKKLGIILIDEKQVTIIKDAENKVFYYYNPTSLIKKSFKRKNNDSRPLDEIDLKILEYAREKPIFLLDAHIFGLRYQTFYHRLKNLEKRGYLKKAISNTSPVPFVRTEKSIITF